MPARGIANPARDMWNPARILNPATSGIRTSLGILLLWNEGTGNTETKTWNQESRNPQLEIQTVLSCLIQLTNWTNRGSTSVNRGNPCLSLVQTVFDLWFWFCLSRFAKSAENKRGVKIQIPLVSCTQRITISRPRDGWGDSFDELPAIKYEKKYIASLTTDKLTFDWISVAKIKAPGWGGLGKC